MSGTEELPWGATLEIVGFAARQQANPEEPAATFGWRLGIRGADVVIAAVLPGSPAIEVTGRAS